MKQLFSVWPDVKILLENRYLVIFLDFDGTLSPIVARPSMAVLSPIAKKIIRELSLLDHAKVVLVSGRSLEDLKKRVGIKSIIYSGNHGLEVSGPKLSHVHPSAVEFRKLAKKIDHRLHLAYAFMSEIFIENKTYSLSIHYRQVPEDKISFAKMILLKEVGTYLSQSQIVLTEGKKVWEIRPPTEWNKGKTVLWLLARVIAHVGKRVLPIYVGDDVTDESSFKALKDRGLTVKVVDDPYEASAAQYYVWSPKDVLEFLQRLHRLKSIEENKGSNSGG